MAERVRRDLAGREDQVGGALVGSTAYQPNAVPEAKVSRTVITDLVQILPDRTFTAVRGDGVIDVKVTGPTRRPVLGALATRFTARLQSLDPGADDLTGWQTAAETTLTSLFTGGPVTPWTGQIGMTPGTTAKWRVLITEEEAFTPDDPAAGDAAFRIVYSDAMEL